MRIKRRVGVFGMAGLLSVSLIGAGIAWAAWSRTETGTGGGASRTMTFTVTAAAGVVDLYPSSSATGSVKFSITNPNPFAIEVIKVEGTGGPVKPDDAVACPAANVTIGTVSGLSDPSYVVAATGGSTAMTVGGVLTMAIDAPQGCQGRTFEVPLKITAQQLVS